MNNEAKNQIKTQLWRLGHRITDVSGLTGYDLLVDNKWKLRVVDKIKIKNAEHIASVITSGCDVVAVVTSGPVPNKLYSFGESVDDSGLKRFNNWQKPFRIFK